MTLGDTLQRISPNDQFILDAAGNLSGLKTPHASGLDLLTDFIGAYAWATLPAAALVPNRRALASDIGIAPGMLVVSDGVRWMPCGVQVLARSSTGVACPTDTTEDTLATLSVPAGIMGVNGSLRVTTRWGFTASTNAKSFKVKLGGTIFHQPAMTAASFTTLRMYSHIQNRASAASQIGDGEAINGFAQLSQTGSVDTTVAQNLTITGQKGLASETLTLESYLVEVMP